MEIVTLVENSCSNDRLKEEFGLSLLVKSEENTILFDMGSSSLFASNAAKMGIDLNEVDCAVVSHGHYDHGGGLQTFFHQNSEAKVYLGREADGDFYGNIGAKIPPFLQPFFYPLVKNRQLLSRYIGLDRSTLMNFHERLVYAEGLVEIKNNIFLLSDIMDDFPIAEGNKYLLEKRDGTLQPDRFVHELVMVIREGDGLVLFTGCGHGGIVNMVKTVQHYFKDEPLKAIVGGFHLALQPGKPGIAGTREDIERIAQEFDSAGVNKVITGHCTGDEASAILQAKMGEKFVSFSTGFSCSL